MPDELVLPAMNSWPPTAADRIPGTGVPFGPRSNSHGHSTTGVQASACRRLVFELVSSAPGSTALLLLLLIPLLQLAGLGDAGREGSAVADIADRIATSFSVEVSLHGILALFLVLAVIRAIAAWGTVCDHSRGSLPALGTEVSCTWTAFNGSDREPENEGFS